MYTLLHKKIKGKPYSIRHYRGFPKLFLENQALLGFHEAKTGVECGSWAKGLRHGFGVAAVQAYIPLNLVQRWLGHAQLSTTAIYAEAVGQEEQAIAARMWR